MAKLKLGIVNSTSIKNAYGGISPFMKNLDPFLTQAFDVTYIVLPNYLNYIRFLPQRLVYAAYLLGKKRKLRKFDVILSHVPEGSYMLSYTKTPFIHIFHGNFNPMSQSRFWYGKYFKTIFEKMERRIIKKATLMYTVGSERHGVPKIINPVYHTVKIKTSELRSGFIFAGRLEKIKNIDKIIRVYAKLSADIQKANPLYIAGMGSQETALKELAASLPIQGRVIFLGNLKNDDLIEADSSKKMLLMASSQEGFPMAIAEAFSLGLPVVATDTGDISRFLKSDYNGFLLPVIFSVEEYVKCIESILDDYDRFSKNALESSAVFKSNRVARDLIIDINKLIEKS
ncbi:MAG TPA: glycosyltransferase [Puia sp.]|jgi:glycosyltransferase involved in cell wall biosynthesis|nr:glycosyltransferase [Puia sp.]